MRPVLVALLAAAALAACGESRPDLPEPPSGTVPPEVQKALDGLDAMLNEASKPVPVRPGFKVDASRVAGMDRLDLWDEVVGQMITAEPSEGDLNASQWAVWLAFQIEVEVSNGGLAQVYFNSAGDIADEAVEQLRVIGAPEHARVLEQANRIIAPQGGVPDREERQRRLRGLAEERFAALEAAWDDEELEQIVATFIRAHPDDFFS